MAIHNLIGGHTREDLKLLNREGILCSRQREVKVIPNVGRMWGGFLFPFISHMLPLQEWGNFFHRGNWGSYPYWFSDGDRGSDRDTFLTCTTLFSRLEMGLFFLALIFAYIPWLNLVVISAKEKHLLKKKGRVATTSLVNTYFSSPQFL